MFKDELNYEEEIKAAEEKLSALRREQAEKLEAEKKAAALARKDTAAPAIEAIDKYEEAKKACNDTIKVAYENYKAAVESAEKDLREIEAAADDELNKFLEQHPEGFHYTYRSKDGKVVRTYDYRHQAYTIFNNYNNFLKAFDELLKF